jgi:hypothetical protein
MKKVISEQKIVKEKYYDIIIIGSGIAGLYCAYNIMRLSPKTSFLILEKYKKEWIGGRTSNETFYGTSIVTGAGIGRKAKDKLLIKLLNELDIKYSEFSHKVNYSPLFKPLDIIKIINVLKTEYKKHPELHNKTFKQFFIKVLGEQLYKQFIMSAGYTDYENADIKDTLNDYGMDDNKGEWTGLSIPWKKLVDTLYHKIGNNRFKFSSNVVSVNRYKENPCLFQVKIENGTVYQCSKIIVATTIDGIKQLFPSDTIYRSIKGQPFLRLYGKFDKKSAEIMKQYVPVYTIVPGLLQKIIPIDANKGIYMIAYCDNNNAIILKGYLENNAKNRELFCHLIEQYLGIKEDTLLLTAIKEFYWPIGTHYYEPLKDKYKNRIDFIKEAQHPDKGILVVGEVVSKNQGWVEGALESVKAVLTKDWIDELC